VTILCHTPAHGLYGRVSDREAGRWCTIGRGATALSLSKLEHLQKDPMRVRLYARNARRHVITLAASNSGGILQNRVRHSSSWPLVVQCVGQ
jgi:hypothetical protein